MLPKKQLQEDRFVYSLAEAVEHTQFKVIDILKHGAKGVLQLWVLVPNDITVMAVADAKQTGMNLSFSTSNLHLLSVSQTDCQLIIALGQVDQRQFRSGYTMAGGIWSEKHPSDFGDSDVNLWIANGALGLYGNFLTNANVTLSKESLRITTVDLAKLAASLDTTEETPDPEWMHKHTSNKLKKLHHAAMNYWQKIQPGAKESYPLSSAIENYLRNNTIIKFPDYLASAGECIIRPDYVDNSSVMGNSYQESNKFRVLKKASKDFWGDIDETKPSTYPHQEEVQLFLVDNGYSESLAQRAALIIRPEGLPRASRRSK